MSQRTTRLRGPLAALLIALGVGAVLLVGEVACFSLHPGVASAANASHPRDLPEGEAFLSAVQLSPTWAWPVTVTQVEIQDPASGEIFTPELILCDQDGHRDGPSMASAWQGPRADFAAHFPGGTQSAVPGTLASQDAVLATLWNPLPPGDRPLTYTIHYRLLGLFPKTETFSYTWDTGEGTVPEGPAGPLAALRALLDLEGTPAKTAVCVLADKEEIGSDGVTGMQSAAFDTFMEDLCESQGAAVRVCFEKSFCLSADVTAAYDPNFSDVYEKRNAAYLNYGIGLCKYTGARGKSGASDADAETVAYIRNLFDEAGVIWQIAELGKVDAGGGGTVAMYMANRNITTLDAGVPVLSMHAPFETVSKLDCYETYKGMKAVFQAEK